MVWMMQVALGVGRADEDKAAWGGVEEEAHVLGAHDWPRLDDLLWRHNLLHYGTSERGHLVVVDGDGVQPADADVGRGASSGGDPGGDLVDALMQKILD